MPTMLNVMPIAVDEAPSGLSASRRRRALTGAAGTVALTILASYLVLYLLQTDVAPVDFHVYRAAAEDIAAGDSPYPAYAYPPLSALAAVPFTFLSTVAADFAVKALLIVGVLGILAVAGVRDWRCYPLALLWPSVNAAVQTGNVTIPLALAAALLWRFRTRPAVAGVSLGASVAAKVFLWPLWLWLVSVGRRSAAVWAVVAGVAITLATWAIVDFQALFGYPDRLRRLNEDTAGAGYTVDALARDLSVPDGIGRGLMAGVAVALLGAVVVIGRRGAEMRSFVLAVGAALACSPIVWLHYFAILLVPVAISRPRLSPLWFVPLAMWGFGAGTGNGTTVETVVVIGVAAATFLFAYRAAPASSQSPHVSSARGRTPTTSLAGGQPR
jgi:glycosyl transferase family 87